MHACCAKPDDIGAEAVDLLHFEVRVGPVTVTQHTDATLTSQGQTPPLPNWDIKIGSYGDLVGKMNVTSWNKHSFARFVEISILQVFSETTASRPWL
jgi:hypothetical protein